VNPWYKNSYEKENARMKPEEDVKRTKRWKSVKYKFSLEHSTHIFFCWGTVISL
jgi:hypothetical protein